MEDIKLAERKCISHKYVKARVPAGNAVNAQHFADLPRANDTAELLRRQLAAAGSARIKHSDSSLAVEADLLRIECDADLKNAMVSEDPQKQILADRHRQLSVLSTKIR